MRIIIFLNNQKDKSLYTTPSFWIFLITSLSSLIYYIFYTAGKPLCHTKGCIIVGDYLKINEWILYLFFTIFCWINFLLLIITYRKSDEHNIYKKLLVISLLSALAFDGSILGYQIWLIKTICWSCIGVAFALFIMLFSLIWLNISFDKILIGMLIWILPFVSHSILKPKVFTVKLKDAVLYTQKPKEYKKPFKIYLFFSLKCYHCTHLICDLSKQDEYKAEFNLCCLSRDKESLKILTYFVKNISKDKNPFKLLCRSVKEKNKLNDQKIDKFVEEKTKMAVLYFKTRSFRGVPLMIVKGRDAEVILMGRDKILYYLIANKILDIKSLRK